MASHVVVIATDLRRTTVKVNPSTYLIDVLQEACKKLKLESDRYLLKHKQKQVDLSVPFRTSGLIGGAKLELVVKANTPSVVQIALQLPQPEAKEIPGGRLIHKFPSDFTIWKLLRQFESSDANAGRNINITARGVAKTASGDSGSGAGQLYYETPVLNIMGREFATFTDFQKTLSQLGHNSGSVLIRLTFRQTSQTLYDAMNQIGEFFKADEEVEDTNNTQQGASSITTAATADVAVESPQEVAPVVAEASIPNPVTDTDKEAGQTSEMQIDEPSGSPGEHQDPYQPVDVFLAPTTATPVAALASLDDETDYNPTIAHAQLHQARLQDNSRNRRLLSDKELEEKAAAEEARLLAIKSVLVKIRFPDNTSSDWNIGPSTTGSFLYEAVRRVMAAETQPFHLVLPGSKTVIKDDSTEKHNLIKVYKLAGRILVNLVWDDSVSPDVWKQPFLKSNIAKQGRAIEVPKLPEYFPDREEKPSTELAQSANDDDSGKRKGEGSTKKIPKWLKLGKK